jgi:hypothetical protein
MSMNLGGVASRNSYGPVILQPIGERKLYSLTQAFDSGEIWGLTREPFVKRSHTNPTTGQEAPVTIVPMVDRERLYNTTLSNYVRVITEKLNFRPPFVVECGAVGLHGAYLGVPVGGLFGDGNTIGPVMRDEIRKRYTLEDVSAGAIKDLLRLFYATFYDMVAIARKDAMTPQFIAKYNLPSL